MKLDSLKKKDIAKEFGGRLSPLPTATRKVERMKELEDLTLFVERKRKKQRRWEPTLFNRKVESR